MKQTLIITLMFLASFTYSQNVEVEKNFRQLKGKLLDQFGNPFPGQNIIIKGTEIGTQTDLDGNFCLAIPKDKILFIEFPLCFEPMTREIKPNDSRVNSKIGKEKHKSRRANRNWIKNKDLIVVELNKIYSSISYKEIEKVICR